MLNSLTCWICPRIIGEANNGRVRCRSSSTAARWPREQMAEKGLNGRKIAKLPCQLLAVSRNVLSINVSWNRVGVEPLRGNLTRLEGGVFVTSGQVGGITTGKMILTRRLIDAIRRGGRDVGDARVKQVLIGCVLCCSRWF